MPKVKLSDYVIGFLADKGVTHLFEVIGGAITHLVDSTIDQQSIRCVTVHHEQAAAFAAEGYARMKGQIGVALATSGPGATNLITGIGSCFFDSIPCVFITGQVNTYEYKFDKPVRQMGFQETDIVSIVRPITKYATMVTEPEKIRYELEKAVFLATSGRPGPVLLDLPMNVQRAEIDPDTLASFQGEYGEIGPDEGVDSGLVREVCSLINHSERPVILVGGGVRAAGATDELTRLIDRTGIPVVASLMGLDAFPHDHPVYRGMIGVYGNRHGNLTLANCDLLLVLGSRLDTRQTGTRPDTFARAAKVVHVDIDASELNHKVPAHLAIGADVKGFLRALNETLEISSDWDLSNWIDTTARFQRLFPSFPVSQPGIDSNRFMKDISEAVEEDAIICLDVGQHQMWAAQSFGLRKGQRMLISGGMGAMGFALPVAIGAAFASPGRRVVVIAGDGGFQMNIQELQTIVRNRLPITIFIMNNYSLGMVRQFQEIYFNRRYQSTVVGYSCPDFVAVGKAYGLETACIGSEGEAREILARYSRGDAPSLVEVRMGIETTVEPKLVVNRSIEDQDPPLNREELRKLMWIDMPE